MELPLEIIDMIGTHCDDRTWGRLRRTCGAINNVLKPQRQQRWFTYLVREGDRTRRRRPSLRRAVYLPLHKPDFITEDAPAFIGPLRPGDFTRVHHLFICEILDMPSEFIVARHCGTLIEEELAGHPSYQKIADKYYGVVFFDRSVITHVNNLW